MAELVLGRLKFNWKGNWTSTTAYIKDDVVKYGPSAYVCTVNHTSSTDFNFSNFQLMTEGIGYAGIWDNGTDYQVNDIVSYGGAIYVCTADHAYDASTDTTPTNPSYWSRLVGGLEWEGDYNGSSTYQRGDIVSYGGYAYIAIQDTQGNAPTNVIFWEVITQGYVELGAWSQSVAYKPGEVVDYGPYKFVVKEGQTPPIGNKPITTNSQYWQLFLKGSSFAGDFSDATEYKRGEIVRFGGRQYICIQDTSAGFNPEGTGYWQLYSKGFDWKGAWSSLTRYKVDDIAEFSGTAYIAIQAGLNRSPATQPSYWQLFAQGDATYPLTTLGDLMFRGQSNAAERLPIGPNGAFLVVNNGVPSWGIQAPERNYYVSLTGDDNNDGQTPATAWRTLQHACQETFSIGQCKVSIFSGTYNELCPLKVGRGVVIEGDGLGAVTISPENILDKGFGTGTSKDGSTPNANSEVFHVNNAARIRNIVFRGFTNGAVCVSLDPGYGPNDTSVWITSQSPYIQNCTSFTDGGTGMIIDGARHNGGYRSIVANDWTQINSDGYGIIVRNDGRSELVSCFTYYCIIGYLCESGGKIRAVGGNNSYGTYGAVARGFSQLETPLTANIQLNDDTINSIATFASNIHVFTAYKDFNGNTFYAGHTNPTGTSINSSSWSNSQSVPIVIKLDTEGAVDWIYSYTGAYGTLSSVVEFDDQIYLGGTIYSGGSNKGFLLKLNQAGEIGWQKTVGDTDSIVDLTTDRSSYLYAVGNHTTFGASVLKVQPSGIISWTKALDYNDSSVNTLSATSICYAGTPTTSTDTYAAEGDATAEDDLFIACRDGTANTTMIVRMTSAGTLATAYKYGDIFINKLRLDTGNGDGIYMMAAGYYNPVGAVDRNPMLMRVSIIGNVAWQNQIAISTSNGEWKDVLPFGDDVYASGYINDSSNTYNRGIIARYSSTGARQWVRLITNTTNSVAFAGLALDGVNVIVSGITQANSVIVNIQRDLTNGLGTVSVGSWNMADASETTTVATVATKTIQNIYLQTPTLALTDSALTLNQSPGQTRTVAASRSGFAGIGTGINFSVSGLAREPKEGSVVQISGDSETYYLISIANFDSGSGTCEVALDPAIPSNKTPNDNTSIIFREAFSQVRMTGHDFLDIGTGGFASTNYPVIISADYAQSPNQLNETLSEDGGRVFYVTTDQDGNFRVGDYFKVEQATGRSTINAQEFNLSGLNELQLGSITAGRQGATVNEFSTDGTFTDNSDTAVPTERAVKTYIDGRIAGLSTTSVQDTAGTTTVTTEAVANTVVVTANSVEGMRISSTATVFNESGVDRDLRVEGDTNANLLFVDASTDRVGIKTATPGFDFEVNGTFAATSKNFIIKHPTKDGYRLCYASLEGPENGVYVRGRTSDAIIYLPEYWLGLVNEESISVNLTSIGSKQDVWVEKIEENKVFLGGNIVDCYYTVYGERKDIDPLLVEIKE
jgi:hypothetical protein